MTDEIRDLTPAEKENLAHYRKKRFTKVTSPIEAKLAQARQQIEELKRQRDEAIKGQDSWIKSALHEQKLRMLAEQQLAKDSRRADREIRGLKEDASHWAIRARTAENCLLQAQNTVINLKQQLAQAQKERDEWEQACRRERERRIAAEFNRGKVVAQSRREGMEEAAHIAECVQAEPHHRESYMHGYLAASSHIAAAIRRAAEERKC